MKKPKLKNEKYKAKCSPHKIKNFGIKNFSKALYEILIIR